MACPLSTEGLIWDVNDQDEVSILEGKEHLKESDKKAYIGFCQTRNNLPIFYEPWYLDAVCQNGLWDVIVHKEDNSILACWPYMLKKKWWGFRYITMPPLTPYLGILVAEEKFDLKSSSKRSKEKSSFQALSDDMPRVHLVNSNFHPGFLNGLPLRWKGFEFTVRYTYRLELTRSPESLWAEIASKQRNRIKTNSDEISIYETADAESFYELNAMSFKRQGLKTPYSKKWFLNYDRALREREARTIFVGENPNGEKVSGVYCIHDSSVAYCMAIGSHPKHRHKNGIGILLWHAIKHFQAKGLITFDFEGGNLEPIEKFFRSFGGELVPYFKVSKGRPEAVLHLLRLLRKI